MQFLVYNDSKKIIKVHTKHELVIRKNYNWQLPTVGHCRIYLCRLINGLFLIAYCTR